MRSVWLLLTGFLLLGLSGPGQTQTQHQDLRLDGGEWLFELSATPHGPLVLPADVAIGKQGQIYVVDGGNHRLVAFDTNGDFLFAVGRQDGRPGSASGEFRDPVGIATDANGRVFVADKGNGRVQVFDPTGKVLTVIPVRDSQGPSRPVGVVASDKGEIIYVSSNLNHNIMVFNLQGELLHEWGGEGVANGQFRFPASLALKNNLLYTIDGLNSRIQIFSFDGEYRFRVGEWGVLQGQLFRPKGVALDRQNRIYVSDGYMDVVQVYGSDYRLSHVFGNQGRIHRFQAPGGMAIDLASNRLFVVEMLANRISVFQLQ